MISISMSKPSPRADAGLKQEFTDAVCCWILSPWKKVFLIFEQNYESYSCLFFFVTYKMLFLFVDWSVGNDTSFSGYPPLQKNFAPWARDLGHEHRRETCFFWQLHHHL